MIRYAFQRRISVMLDQELKRPSLFAGTVKNNFSE